MSKTLKDRPTLRKDVDTLPISKKIQRRPSRVEFNARLNHSDEDWDDLDDLPTFEKM